VSRARILVALVGIVVLAAVGLRLAVTPSYIGGYRVVDDYNIALQVIGARTTWRAVTIDQETSQSVTVGVSEATLQIGAGFDDRIAYVVVQLAEPLAGRTVINATTGSQIPLLSP